MSLSKQHIISAGNWLQQNFGEQIKEGLDGTPWTLPLVQAIFCKETAVKVLLWIDKYPADIILQRCVFDTSGEPEFPQAPRRAFPQNRSVFEAKYGRDFLQDLVEESNKQREMPQWSSPKGWNEAPFLAKGYGLFQYDLQNIVNDENFFRNKLWYSFSECLMRLVRVLNAKAAGKDNLHGIVKAYNGSGSKAEEYAGEVLGYMKAFV